MCHFHVQLRKNVNAAEYRSCSDIFGWSHTQHVMGPIVRLQSLFLHTRVRKNVGVQGMRWGSYSDSPSPPSHPIGPVTAQLCLGLSQRWGLVCLFFFIIFRPFLLTKGKIKQIERLNKSKTCFLVWALYYLYDCKTFTTQTFTTQDVHHPRRSPPQTFTTSDGHHPRHSPP